MAEVTARDGRRRTVLKDAQEVKHAHCHLLRCLFADVHFVLLYIIIIILKIVKKADY